MKESDDSAISIENNERLDAADGAEAGSGDLPQQIPLVAFANVNAMDGQNDTIEIKDDTVDLAMDSSSNLSAGLPSSSAASFASDGGSRGGSNDESDEAEETTENDEEALLPNPQRNVQNMGDGDGGGTSGPFPPDHPSNATRVDHPKSVPVNPSVYSASLVHGGDDLVAPPNIPSRLKTFQRVAPAYSFVDDTKEETNESFDAARPSGGEPSTSNASSFNSSTSRGSKRARLPSGNEDDDDLDDSQPPRSRQRSSETAGDDVGVSLADNFVSPTDARNSGVDTGRKDANAHSIADSEHDSDTDLPDIRTIGVVGNDAPLSGGSGGSNGRGGGVGERGCSVGSNGLRRAGGSNEESDGDHGSGTDGVDDEENGGNGRSDGVEEDGGSSPSGSTSDGNRSSPSDSDGVNDVEVVGVQQGIIDVEEDDENRPKVIRSISSSVIVIDSDDDDDDGVQCIGGKIDWVML